MYGTLITETGWTFEYVDGLELSRALEFLGYLGKRAEAQRKAAKETNHGNEDFAEPNHNWQPMTEEDTKNRFAITAAVAGGQLPATRMSSQQRDLVRWAEEMMGEHGVN